MERKSWSKDFRNAFEKLPINLFRVVVANDPIARVPGMLIPYEHVGQLIQIDESGDMYDHSDINTAILFTKRILLTTINPHIILD